MSSGEEWRAREKFIAVLYYVRNPLESSQIPVAKDHEKAM